MHIPSAFQQADEQQLFEIIRQYPFTTLITHSQAGIDAFHLPLIISNQQGKPCLQGHVAKVNPLWKMVDKEMEVLLVFNGPHCYISPNHYPTKQQTGRAVPTWNYVTVHVNGLMRCRFDDQFKLDMLNNLAFQHEQGQDTPWSIENAPEQYIQRMLSAIVGLEIDILSIEGQWKLSQNQPEINKKGVIMGLEKEANSDAQKIAALIQQQATQSA